MERFENLLWSLALLIIALKIDWVDIAQDNEWTDDIKLDERLDELINEKYDFIGRFIEERNGFYAFDSGRNYRKDGKLSYYFFSLFPKSIVLKAKELEVKKYIKKKKR